MYNLDMVPSLSLYIIDYINIYTQICTHTHTDLHFGRLVIPNQDHSGFKYMAYRMNKRNTYITHEPCRLSWDCRGVWGHHGPFRRDGPDWHGEVSSKCIHLSNEYDHLVGWPTSCGGAVKSRKTTYIIYQDCCSSVKCVKVQVKESRTRSTGLKANWTCQVERS